jgi:transglutaminase-like putative cysteine protease
VSPPPRETPPGSETPGAGSPADPERPAGTGLEEYIVGSLEDMEPAIDVSDYGIDTDEMGDIYLGIVSRHPELFYVENETEWTYYEGGEVMEVIPAYSGSKMTVARQRERFDAAFEEALEEIGAGRDSADTVALVNDWICLNTRYDTSYTDATAYNALVDGSGVCDAYSKLFALFMEHYGIKWRILMSEPMDHSWNQVLIDGQWLHVDVTWNDPVPDERGRALRDYLLMTDDEITQADEPHYDWTAA